MRGQSLSAYRSFDFALIMMFMILHLDFLLLRKRKCQYFLHMKRFSTLAVQLLNKKITDLGIPEDERDTEDVSSNEDEPEAIGNNHLLFMLQIATKCVCCSIFSELCNLGLSN